MKTNIEENHLFSFYDIFPLLIINIFIVFPPLFINSSLFYFIMYFILILFNISCILKFTISYPMLFTKYKSNIKDQQKSIQLIGHRGSRNEELTENTIAAFKDAIKAGADVIELDVWLSKDGQVIVHHDKEFTRMTNGQSNAKVTDLNYHDYPMLIPPLNQRNRCLDNDGNFLHDTIHVPLLREVLEIIPNHVNMIIEFKHGPDELIDQVITLIHQSDERYQSLTDEKIYLRQNNVFWFSLDEKVNDKLRQRKVFPTITSILGMLKVLLIYYLGLIAFVDIDDDVFGITVSEITLDQIRKETAVSFLPDIIKQLLAYALAGKPPYLMLAPKLFAHLRRRGIPVWFLGVNDESDLKLAVKSGATAILTDRISWAKQYIDDNQLRFSSIAVTEK